MNNSSVKLRPRDFWNIGEHESWFADMANEGLHLKKMGRYFAHFTKDVPRKIKYRIDVCQEKEEKITPEQKEMYSESGWEYVTSYDEFNVFASPVDANAPELYRDPVEQSFMIDQLEERYKKNINLAVLKILVLIGAVIAAWYFDFVPYVDLVEGGLVKYSLILILVLYNGYNYLQAALSIRHLRIRLLEGEAINHAAAWETQHQVKIFITCIFAIFAVLGATLPIIQRAMTKQQTLPITSNDLPIVRLADIEQNPNLERMTDIQKNIDRNNFYRYRWSILAPVQYISSETATIKDKVGKNGNDYLSSIHTSVYKLKFSFMNDALITDLMKNEGITVENKKVSEIKHPNFDKLIIYDSSPLKELYAYKDSAVVCIRYNGDVDINVLIEATAVALERACKE
jgi:hypothetical protein